MSIQDGSDGSEHQAIRTVCFYLIQKNLKISRNQGIKNRKPSNHFSCLVYPPQIPALPPGVSLGFPESPLFSQNSLPFSIPLLYTLEGDIRSLGLAKQTANGAPFPSVWPFRLRNEKAVERCFGRCFVLSSWGFFEFLWVRGLELSLLLLCGLPRRCAIETSRAPRLLTVDCITQDANLADRCFLVLFLFVFWVFSALFLRCFWVFLVFLRCFFGGFLL